MNNSLWQDTRKNTLSPFKIMLDFHQVIDKNLKFIGDQNKHDTAK